MVEETKRKADAPAWQSDRSERWAFGEKEANPREAKGGRPLNVRSEEAAKQMAPPLESLDDTPEMRARRERMRRPSPGESLVGDDASDGFQIE